MVSQDNQTIQKTPESKMLQVTRSHKIWLFSATQQKADISLCITFFFSP